MNDELPLPPLALEIGEKIGTSDRVEPEQLSAWSTALRALPDGQIGNTVMAICQIAAWHHEQGRPALGEALLELGRSASAELARETAMLQAEIEGLDARERRQLLAFQAPRAPRVGESAPEGSVSALEFQPLRRI
ncbi:MAG: hypothetical protein U1E65_18365 [Myxococcota bacterium]